MTVVAIVDHETLRSMLQTAIAAEALRFVTDRTQFLEDSEGFSDGMFDAVICEVTTTEFANEIGQVMRNQCPKTPTFACALDRTVFEPKIFRKNGFTDAFLLPLERQELLDQLAQQLSPESVARRRLKRVLLPDLQPDTAPPFTTYVHLPLNNKYLVYSAKGSAFTEKKVTKLKARQVGTLFIDQKESDAFYTYVASEMKRGDNTLSSTERQEKLKDSVRQIFTEVFDARANDTMDSGRELMDSCRRMVSAYITGGVDTDFHGQLLKNINGGGLEYSHAADVSTIASLFGLAVGAPRIDDLAIAGFLHDLGLADFPQDHGYGLDPLWTDEIKKMYLEHPQRSVNLIKTKKMIISTDAEVMILQHHERFDGKGFPRGLIGDRISRDAQLLSLADQFQYGLSVDPGQDRRSPSEILDTIGSNGSIAPDLFKLLRAALKI